MRINFYNQGYLNFISNGKTQIQHQSESNIPTEVSLFNSCFEQLGSANSIINSLYFIVFSILGASTKETFSQILQDSAPKTTMEFPSTERKMNQQDTLVTSSSAILSQHIADQAWCLYFKNNFLMYCNQKQVHQCIENHQGQSENNTPFTEDNNATRIHLIQFVCSISLRNSTRFHEIDQLTQLMP
ncbi:UNKNOWN [Stylonychia lemnae]|uniref:Uncharacterized protein n=1 Tax=Stylonychia lemnae TaxID=5949 RepID=A0A078AD80_STYLE|nr:UNKNOWN [Stylonychia lemnae]|eukprot:CDW80199.1 UNKNOWN [Stylonychia lemnae]